MKIMTRIPINKPKRAAFDLSHERKFSMNMGDLVPVLCQEVVPGDKFRISMEQLVRFQPLIAPMMHRVNVFTHFFFVPNRLVWNEWEKFITGGDTGIDTPVFPRFVNTLNVSSLKSSNYKYICGYGSLMDYLGFPVRQIMSSSLTTQVPPFNISQLPFRAYQLIYNEYYRDENLQPKADIPLTSGNSNFKIDLVSLRKRAWEKDYFTSALPYAQKGTELTMPLSGDAPIKAAAFTASVGDVVSGIQHHLETAAAPGTALRADLSAATGSTINELRQAFQIQKWLERNARGGSRYVEQLLSHFGVKSSDSRLQRPEYLGGGKTPVTVSEVLQMSETTDGSPQGNMAGHGVSVGSSHQFSRSFEEHGFVIGIMSVLPRTAYFQGVPRFFMKSDRYEYFWPEFAHLGEQEVRNEELFWDPNPAVANTVNKAAFGYQPRYTEYRYIPDTVHGDFANNLKFWHMGREFSTRPGLNDAFIKCQGDTLTRPFAVQDANVPKLLVQTYCNFQAVRPIPRYGSPGGI